MKGMVGRYFFFLFLIFFHTFFLSILILVDFVLEYIQVVGSGHGNDILLGVPCGVQDLLVEIQAVHTDLVLLPLAAGAHLPGLQNGTGFTVLPGRLQRDISPGVPVEHPEEVVIGAGHDGTAERGRERQTERGGEEEGREKKYS